ncbi:MAG: hypothetical protein ACKPHU_01250, partial [Planctomycetaceae bacterium]
FCRFCRCSGKPDTSPATFADSLDTVQTGPSGNLVGRGVEEWADEAQHSSDKNAWTDHRFPRLLVL